MKKQTKDLLIIDLISYTQYNAEREDMIYQSMYGTVFQTRQPSILRLTLKSSTMPKAWIIFQIPVHLIYDAFNPFISKLYYTF